MTRSPTEVVGNVWCSYPLKGTSSVFVSLGSSREYVKPGNTNARKAREECIVMCRQETSTSKGYILG